MQAENPHAVLVVDDEVFIRMVAADVLSETGIAIYEAGNSSEALAVLEAHPDVALIFTDVNMPGDMDGLELSGVVHRRWPHIKLIVTSGRQIISDRSLPDNGTFLPKPYAPSDLIELVEKKLSDEK